MQPHAPLSSEELIFPQTPEHPASSDIRRKEPTPTAWSRPSSPWTKRVNWLHFVLMQISIRTTVSLVDTIDTLKSGIPNAIKVFEELKKKGQNP
jgi:hypothetical protein